MRGAGLFFFLLFLFLILGSVAWVSYTQIRARRAGLPPPTWKSYIPFMKSASSTSNYPSPRSTGPLDWIKGKIDGMSKNKRTARGAYEGPGGLGGNIGYSAEAGDTGGARRGRGLEDDAWDIRVGNEDPYGPNPGGYGYEEQELGLAPTPGYAPEPYNSGHSDYISQGGAGHRSNLSADNPFSDQHEASSMRSVSPNPQPQPTLQRNNTDQSETPSSPVSVRKSIFRERI